ncbi:hypothetical protein V8E53_014584 [Lactarius tabidus]
MQFFAALLSTVALAVSTTATPLHVTERSELIVNAPRLTVPHGGDIWPIKSTQQVCWDISNPPPNTQNATGVLYLGFLANGSENLDLDHPLKTGFLLSDGCTSVTVPEVPTGDNYIVDLMGDSGDVTDAFSIVPSE